jgi:hypothetical protein
MKHIWLVITFLISSFMQTGVGSPFAKFEPLYIAAKPLQVAIETRPNLFEFGAMLKNFAAEVSAAKEMALSPEEKALVTEYETAYQSFRDAEFFWRSGLPPKAGGRAIEGKIVLVRSWECLNPLPDRKDVCPTPNPRIEEPALYPFIQKYTLNLIQEKKPMYSRRYRGKEKMVMVTLTETSVSVAEGLRTVIATASRQLTAANKTYLSKV